MTEPLQLLQDDPLRSEDWQRIDAARLAPLVDALANQLWPALQQGYAGQCQADGHSPLRVGLFGGYGQGKSTVVAQVQRALKARLPARPGWRGCLQGPRILEFDSSHYKSADLEWRLLEALTSGGLWRWQAVLAPVLLVLLALGSAALAIGLFWDFAGFTQAHWRTAAQWLSAVLAIYAAWGAGLAGKAIKWASALFKAKQMANSWLPNHDIAYTHKELRWQRWARWLGTLPALVIIDDLDRASVEQQRSLLRAARRYSKLLGFALLVCMDDAPLLAAEANPEAPEELLRKVVHLELRVPERGPEDWVLLAAYVLRELAERNPGLQNLLCHPMLVADLARVLALWPAPAGPRLAKRLANDTALQLHQLNAWSAAWFSAALRLQALWYAAPALRQQRDRLRQVLECNHPTAFTALLDEQAAGLPPQRRAAAQHLFERTRMMQPSGSLGWQTLLSATPNTAEAARHGDAALLTLQTRVSWNLDLAGSATNPANAHRVSQALHAVLEVMDTELQGFHHDGEYLWWLRTPADATGQDRVEFPGFPASRPSPALASCGLPGSWLVRQDPPAGKPVPNPPPMTPLANAEFHAHVWALWVVRLAGLDAMQRRRGCDALARWLVKVGGGHHQAPADFVALMHYLALREQAADGQAWQLASLHERQALMGRLMAADPSQSLPWLLQLDAQDLPMAMRFLAQLKAGASRDLRASSQWLWALAEPVMPAALSMLKPQDVGDPWPAVRPSRDGADEWFALLGVHLQLWVRLWRPRSLPPATLMLALQQAHARLSAEQLAGLLAIVLTDPETGRASAIDLLAQVHQHLRGRGLSREQRPLPLSEEPCFHSGSAPASQWAALWWDCLNGWPPPLSFFQKLGRAAVREQQQVWPHWVQSEALRTLLKPTFDATGVLQTPPLLSAEWVVILARHGQPAQPTTPVAHATLAELLVAVQDRSDFSEIKDRLSLP